MAFRHSSSIALDVFGQNGYVFSRHTRLVKVRQGVSRYAGQYIHTGMDYFICFKLCLLLHSQFMKHYGHAPYFLYDERPRCFL